MQFNERKFKDQTEYPQAFVVGADLYSAINDVNRKRIDALTLLSIKKEIIASKPETLEAAILEYVTRATSLVTQTTTTPTATSRKERNAILKQNGYRWKRVKNDDEDIDLRNFPEYYFILVSPSGEIIDEDEALKEINNV